MVNQISLSGCNWSLILHGHLVPGGHLFLFIKHPEKILQSCKAICAGLSRPLCTCSFFPHPSGMRKGVRAQRDKNIIGEIKGIGGNENLKKKKKKTKKPQQPNVNGKKKKAMSCQFLSNCCVGLLIPRC